MNLWNFKTFFGEKNEDVCCFSVNTGLMAAMLEENNIKATFCGHDHNNDLYGDYFGIGLFYGRKTGHGGYGPPQHMKRGARVLLFSMGAEGQLHFDTWIR